MAFFARSRSALTLFAAVALLVALAAGCSARGGGDLVRRDSGAGDLGALDGATPDATPDDAGADAGTGSDAGDDASMLVPTDAGTDGGQDAGHVVVTDAGTDAGRDAGTDAGMTGPPTNDTCATGIDVTGDGTFTGTTCGADDTLALGLGPPGCSTPVSSSPTPDVFYVVHTAPSGSSYRLTITPGFAIQYVPSVCSGNGGCGPYPGTMDFTIGGGGSGTVWYFAVEKSDGTCGPFTLTVSGS